MKKKIMVTGFGFHGKDTFCEFLGKFGYKTMSSSLFMAEFVFEKIGKKYGYKNSIECWNDRRNHRDEWFDLIVEYNTPDLSKLAENLFKEYDIYCGIRNRDEFFESKSKKLFDLSVWIDASERLEPEDSNSMTITKEDCDVVIDNNGTLGDLEKNVELFYEKYLKD